MARETILVVEDNDVMRLGLQALLEESGYDVMSAVHGEEALDQMSWNIPDLILSDISMPEMDGYSFFEAVRSHPEWVSIPFIFLTARGEREETFKGRQLGVEDYLIKPITQDELITTVQSRLARNQQLLLAKLQEAYEASLIMLVNAIDLRDHYTRGHVERVMNYALAITDELGCSRYERDGVRFGAILHDIGKIHIQDRVLRKTGPLNREEWMEMKKHPVIGAEMIKDIPYLAPAIQVIRYHHERWDGSGYPAGLAGEAIPRPARIVAVADSFDAMTTERPYRNTLTPEGAFQTIVESSGLLFDPAVVSAFKVAWKANRFQAALSIR
jgi:putative nucleotidyltransferase with HDIG domain